MSKSSLCQKVTTKFLTANSYLWGIGFRYFLRIPIVKIHMSAAIYPTLPRTQISDHIYVITSVISPSRKKLSYSTRRSFFNDADRLMQTTKTIESIRKFDQHAKIALIECSNRKQSISTKVEDVDIYQITKWFSRLVINGPYKGLGEGLMLIATSKITDNYRTVSKISGRYELYKPPASTPMVLFSVSNELAITIYYRMDNYIYKKWITFIELNLNSLSKGMSIESLLTQFTERNNLRPVENLGVRGFNGITGGLTQI